MATLCYIGGMRLFVLAAALFFSSAAIAAPVDPLNVTIDQADADRFATLFRETGGKPTAAQLQKRYLDGAGDGVRIFTLFGAPILITSGTHR